MQTSAKLPKEHSSLSSSGSKYTLLFTTIILLSLYQCFTSELVTINDLPQVFRAVFDARTKWYDIGLELNIDAASLDAVQNDNPHNVQNCLRDMLKKWLRRSQPKPTWGALKEALESPLVDEGHLIATFPHD